MTKQNYFIQEKNKIKLIDTFGLLIGSRGTKSTLLSDHWKNIKLNKKCHFKFQKSQYSSF